MVDLVISTFSPEHVTRITGLTPRQLTYWDTTDFFTPAHASIADGNKVLRVYSFKDVVGLRVVSFLRNQHKISMQHLREVAEKLSAYADAPWASLKLYVCKGEVGFIEPGTDRPRGVLSDQYVLVSIAEQITHVTQAAADLNRRRPDQIGSVDKRRNVVHNVQVIAGTRVPVRAIERFLAAGYSVSAILAEYPSVEKEDIEAIAQRGFRGHTDQAAA